MIGKITPRKVLRRAISRVGMLSEFPTEIRHLYDLILRDQTRKLQNEHPNPLNKFGKKCFSQTDEDGITLEILRRIGAMGAGGYAEFGVGNGTENNTLILAALGWSGFWVGGEQLAFNHLAADPRRFCYIRDWITRDNIVSHARAGLRAVNLQMLDVISLDLDGNDIYLVEQLLAHQFRPKLFIVEYNGKFPPPVKFQISYDPAHVWQGDDYFGASLSSFEALFADFGYRLICCNSHSGANAFFIERSLDEHFADVPSDIGHLYVAPRYHVYHEQDHPRSLKVIEKLFAPL
jgi:hypothetical protein